MYLYWNIVTKFNVLKCFVEMNPDLAPQETRTLKKRSDPTPTEFSVKLTHMFYSLNR